MFHPQTGPLGPWSVARQDAMLDAQPERRGSGDEAFEPCREGNRELYVMNADGTAQTNLTNNAGSDADPSFPLRQKR